MKKSLQLIALKFSVVKLVHPLNAPFSIEVTLLGIVTEVRLLHPLNAEFPIVVTVLGIVTFDCEPKYFVSRVFVESEYTKSPSIKPYIILAPHGLPVAVPL